MISAGAPGTTDKWAYGMDADLFNSGTDVPARRYTTALWPVSFKKKKNRRTTVCDCNEGIACSGKSFDPRYFMSKRTSRWKHRRANNAFGNVYFILFYFISRLRIVTQLYIIIIVRTDLRSFALEHEYECSYFS